MAKRKRSTSSDSTDTVSVPNGRSHTETPNFNIWDEILDYLQELLRTQYFPLSDGYDAFRMLSSKLRPRLVCEGRWGLSNATIANDRAIFHLCTSMLTLEYRYRQEEVELMQDYVGLTPEYLFDDAASLCVQHFQVMFELYWDWKIDMGSTRFHPQRHGEALWLVAVVIREVLNTMRQEMEQTTQTDLLRKRVDDLDCEAKKVLEEPLTPYYDADLEEWLKDEGAPVEYLSDEVMKEAADRNVPLWEVAFEDLMLTRRL